MAKAYSPNADKESRAAQLSALQAEINGLRRQLRPSSEFEPWKPNIFYYLFSVAASMFASTLMRPASSLDAQTLVTVLTCFGVLCYAPIAVNRFSYLAGFKWPNKRLRKQLATLQKQLDQLTLPPSA